MVLLYTDGVTETAGAEDRFGADRLRRLLVGQRRRRRRQSCCARSTPTLTAFRGGAANDDIAALALRPRPLSRSASAVVDDDDAQQLVVGVALATETSSLSSASGDGGRSEPSARRLAPVPGGTGRRSAPAGARSAVSRAAIRDPAAARGGVGGQRVGDQVDVGEAIEREVGGGGERPRQPSEHAGQQRDRRERDDDLVLVGSRSQPSSGSAVAGLGGTAASRRAGREVASAPRCRPRGRRRSRTSSASARITDTPMPVRRSAEQRGSRDPHPARRGPSPGARSSSTNSRMPIGPASPP